MNWEDIKTEFRKFSVDEHYLERYCKFVRYYHQMNTSNKYEVSYHKHHILPKGKNFWYKYKDIKANPWNCAILTPRQHFISHLMLYRLFKAGVQRAFMLSSLLIMCRGSEKVLNSRLYVNLMEEHRVNMIKDNPMKNPETVLKMRDSVARFMKSARGLEYKAKISEDRKGKSMISEQGLEKLSALWSGVERPRKEGQQDKIRQSSSKGLFSTPWGDFWSPQHAADSSLNTLKLSRYTVNRRCKHGTLGFSYIAKDETDIEKRGKWTRT